MSLFARPLFTAVLLATPRPLRLVDGHLGVWMRFSDLQTVAFDYFTADLWELWE